MGLFETLKQLSTDASNAAGPVIIQFGEVRKTNPLEITVDQRLHLTSEFLIIPESLIAYEINLQHSHTYTSGTTGDALSEPVVIRRGLEPGDKLILLRMQGGQKYLVLDRVSA